MSIILAATLDYNLWIIRDDNSMFNLLMRYGDLGLILIYNIMQVLGTLKQCVKNVAKFPNIVAIIRNKGPIVVSAFHAITGDFYNFYKAVSKYKLLLSSTAVSNKSKLLMFNEYFYQLFTITRIMITVIKLDKQYL